MNNFMLRLEPIAGSDVKECIREAKILKAQLGIPITFKFNGVSISIFSHSDDVEEKFCGYIKGLERIKQ